MTTLLVSGRPNTGPGTQDTMLTLSPEDVPMQSRRARAGGTSGLDGGPMATTASVTWALRF